MSESPLSGNRIRTQLLSAMKDGAFSQSERLPRENVLAEQMGISRTQLRDVLASLEREGFITRRHGVGTIINHHVLHTHTRIDIEKEFLDMIRESGKTPGIAFVRPKLRTADETVARQLRLEVGEAVVCVSRLITADGVPAIYCEDSVARKAMHGKATAQDIKRPFFYFLREFCDIVPYLDLTELSAVAADETLGKLLRLPAGTPLLRMDEVDYDVAGKPVFCSKQFYVNGVIHPMILRKKL